LTRRKSSAKPPNAQADAVLDGLVDGYIPVLCPKCAASSDGDEIVHTEWVIQDRKVRGMCASGVIDIDGQGRVFDECSKGEMFECKHCGHRWRVPKKVDYV
jgi:hypothetical protein